MNILVTGNLGYVGPELTSLIDSLHSHSVVGIDLKLFYPFPFTMEPSTLKQIVKDIRTVTLDDFVGIDVVIHLAAISNDPMGNQFEELTHAVNEVGSIRVAQLAKTAGVSRFIFASSCSVYGANGSDARVETDQVNPVTTYARSKINVENHLKSLASKDFEVFALRFATACGWSKNLRLDLVVNDFVASAISTGKIVILSNGEPWRPLIDVSDMAKAIVWSVTHPLTKNENYLCVNVGSNQNNYQVREIAELVADTIGGVAVDLDDDASPDKRSYRVSFDKFSDLAGSSYTPRNLISTISNLVENLSGSEGLLNNFRHGKFIRLNVLREKTDLIDKI